MGTQHRPDEPGEQSGTGGQDRTGLAGNVAGVGVTHEAARRRQAEGAGADRSWRVGADGEATVAQLPAPLTTPSRWDRLRGRDAAWRVLHSVPLGDGHGRIRGDVDHLLIGPVGVVSINAKHHRGGRLVLDGDEPAVNGYPSQYVPKARREAQRVAGFLRPALRAAGLPELAEQVPVRPLIVVVSGRLLVETWPSGVTVVMGRRLAERLQVLPPALDSGQVAAVYEIARRSTTWNPLQDR